MNSKVRRVGSITLGVFLVAVGLVFALRMFIPRLDFEILLSFWPVVLIALGAEVLVSSSVARKNGEDLRYDGGAIFIMVLVCIFSFVMAGAYYVVENAAFL